MPLVWGYIKVYRHYRDKICFGQLQIFAKIRQIKPLALLGKFLYT